MVSNQCQTWVFGHRTPPPLKQDKSIHIHSSSTSWSNGSIFLDPQKSLYTKTNFTFAMSICSFQVHLDVFKGLKHLALLEHPGSPSNLLIFPPSQQGWVPQTSLNWLKHLFHLLFRDIEPHITRCLPLMPSFQCVLILKIKKHIWVIKQVYLQNPESLCKHLVYNQLQYEKWEPEP